MRALIVSNYTLAIMAFGLSVLASQVSNLAMTLFIGAECLAITNLCKFIPFSEVSSP